MEKTNEIVLFETEDRVITLSVPVEQETVWLNRNQMAELFDRDVKLDGDEFVIVKQNDILAVVK